MDRVISAASSVRGETHATTMNMVMTVIHEPQSFSVLIVTPDMKHDDIGNYYRHNFLVEF